MLLGKFWLVVVTNYWKIILVSGHSGSRSQAQEWDSRCRWRRQWRRWRRRQRWRREKTSKTRPLQGARWWRGRRKRKWRTRQFPEKGERESGNCVTRILHEQRLEHDVQAAVSRLDISIRFGFLNNIPNKKPLRQKNSWAKLIASLLDKKAIFSHLLNQSSIPRAGALV